MELEKRKVLMLKRKIEHIERFSNEESTAAAAFFLGMGEPIVQDTLGKIEREMVQNTDAELLALCRQLSLEISSRVTAELEILRLKESRKIEHDIEIAERAKLREEVERCKKELEKEVQRRQLAEDDKRRWEQSFQQLISG